MARKAPTEKQLMDSFEAINRIEAAMPGARGLPVSMTIDAFAGNLCEQYARIKPYIEPALKFVEWLPRGETIAKVVRLLARVADAFCAATAQPPTLGIAEAIERPRKPSLDPEARFLGANEAFDRLEKELAGDGPAARGISPADNCQVYKKVEPYVEPILGYVEWLPYGTTISKIIRLLARIAEYACG